MFFGIILLKAQLLNDQNIIEIIFNQTVKRTVIALSM
jgi:hypothetical protein